MRKFEVKFEKRLAEMHKDVKPDEEEVWVSYSFKIETRRNTKLLGGGSRYFWYFGIVVPVKNILNFFEIFFKDLH